MVLDPAATRASYDRAAEAYADRFDDELDRKPIDRALLEILPELAELDRHPGVVADLGSGPGQIGRYVARSSGLPVVAIDLSPAMATLALQRHKLPGAAGSLEALPLAGGSVGAAVAFYCFIHLDDDALTAAAAELHRILRPRGVAIVSIHTGDEIRHVETLVDTPVALDFRFMSVDTLTARARRRRARHRRRAGANRCRRRRVRDPAGLRHRPPALTVRTGGDFGGQSPHTHRTFPTAGRVRRGRRCRRPGRGRRRARGSTMQQMARAPTRDGGTRIGVRSSSGTGSIHIVWAMRA